MQKKFNIGDVVKLKSGGPNMTVESYSDDPFRGGEEVICVWFKGNTSARKGFGEDLLEKQYTEPLKIVSR